MCAGPLREFVFVLSRLEISQAWIGAWLSGCASEIQPPGHPPARTRGRSIITARLMIIPTSERRRALIFSRRPRARIWWGKKKRFFGVTPPDPTSRAPSSADLGGRRNNFFGVTPPDPTSRAPSSADLGGQKKLGGSHAGGSNAQSPRARIWGGQKKYFLEQAPDPTPRAPSSADLRGQTQDFGGHTARSNVQGAPWAQIWEDQKKYFLEQAPDPTPRAPSSADLGGETQDFGGCISRSNVQGALERGFGGGKKFWGSRLQIQRSGRPRAQIGQTIRPPRRIGTEKNILKPQSSARLTVQQWEAQTFNWQTKNEY